MILGLKIENRNYIKLFLSDLKSHSQICFPEGYNDKNKKLHFCRKKQIQ